MSVHPEDQPQSDGQVSTDVAANIERYLRNHTGEEAHAWQMNMAARPSHWQPLQDPEQAVPVQPAIPVSSPTPQL